MPVTKPYRSLATLGAGLAAVVPLHAAEIYQDKQTTLDLHGRIEVRYNDNEDEDFWDSGSSRFGIDARKTTEAGWEFFGGVEWAYETGQVGKDDEITNRLLFAGFERSDVGQVAVGKQWSVIYDVVWWTDMGRKFGSRAFGIYNFDDWGQVSGTGRADDSITYRKSFGDWHFGVQYQTEREDVPLNAANDINASLDHGAGASVRYTFSDSLQVGTGYYRNEYKEVSPGHNLEPGDTGDLSVVGGNYTTDNFFFGLGLAYSNNWEIAENGQFFDAFGGQAYGYYHFPSNWRVTLNLNYLEDRGDTSEGYERKTLTPGIEYHFVRDEALVWAEYQFDDGNTWDGAENIDKDNVWAAGFRYYF